MTAVTSKPTGVDAALIALWDAIERVRAREGERRALALTRRAMKVITSDEHTTDEHNEGGTNHGE